MGMYPSAALSVLTPGDVQEKQNTIDQGTQQIAMNKAKLAQVPMQNQLMQQQVDAGKLEQAHQKLTTLAQLLFSANDDASWNNARQQAAGLGVDISQVPDRFDPQVKQQYLGMIIPAKDQLELQLRQAQQSETSRHNRVEEYNQSGGWGMPGTPPSAVPQGNPGTLGAPYQAAVQQVESGGNPNAVSPVGARGDMQIMPTTAANPGFGVRPSNGTPEDDHRTAVDYLNAMFARYPGRPDLALQAYNGGPGRIDKVASGQMSPSALPQETQQYPGKVFAAAGQNGASPQGDGAPKDLNTLRGEDYLTELQKQNPGAPIGQIKAMGTGEQKWPTAFALAKSPAIQKTLNAVYAAYPGASEQTYATVQKFNNGKEAQGIRFINNATAHLDVIGKLGDALENNDTRAINALDNTFKSQFGQAAPTNFNAAKILVAGELTKIIANGAGTGEDRAKAQAALDAASSPAQLKGVISTMKQLLGGQLGGYEQEYSTTGQDNFRTKYLNASTRNMLDSLENPQQQANAGGAHPLDKYMRP